MNMTERKAAHAAFAEDTGRPNDLKDQEHNTTKKTDRYTFLVNLLQKVLNQQEAINYRTTRLELQMNQIMTQLQSAAIDQEVISKYAVQHMTGPQIRAAEPPAPPKQKQPKPRKEELTADDFKRNYQGWEQ